MDFILIIVVLILISIIIVVYVFNKIKQTTDLEKLYELLILDNPTIKTFSLGYNDETKKYANVVRNSDGKLIIQQDDNPIGFDGKYIILTPHGDILEKNDNNGFKVSGMETVDITCPNNYEGLICQLKPLCDAVEDDGKLKPLTYTQFNGLRLYNNTFKKTYVQPRIEEITHPKIRIQCLTNGDYQLEVCGSNEILDTNLNCTIYDVCEDKLTGYKHKTKINDNDTIINEDITNYYVCLNNKSTLMTCPHDTVFSIATSSCTQQTVCYNRNTDTIPIDEYNYIQCSNDDGTKIYCQSKVKTLPDGQLTCNTNLCQPKTFKHEDSNLRYDYGVLQCIDDKPHTILCSTETIKKAFTYEWIETFDYYLDYPKEIYKNNACTSDFDIKEIMYNSIVQMQFSKAMPETHPFDLMKNEYVCETKYRWDYINNKLIPESPTGGIFETATPCNDRETILSYHCETFPKDKVYMIYTINFYSIGNKYSYTWPQYHIPSDKIRYTQARYDKEYLYIETFELSYPPYGFIRESDDVEKTMDGPDNEMAYLIGYGSKPPMDDYKNYQFYTISTNKFALPNAAYPTQILETYKIPIVTEIDTNQNVEFTIDFLSINKPIQLFPDFTIYKYYIVYGDETYYIGFTSFNLVIVDEHNQSMLNIGPFQKQFDRTLYPKLFFVSV